jgi:hypothetical protein
MMRLRLLLWECKMMRLWLRLRRLSLAVKIENFDASPAKKMMRLLVALALAMALHHLDGNPAPAEGGRQNDAALASPPTSFLCSIFSKIHF